VTAKVTAVLDASAVLALLYREPGHGQVAGLLPGAMVSTVNWAEIVAKLGQRGHPDPAAAAKGVRSLGVRVEPFTAADAVRAGSSTDRWWSPGDLRLDHVSLRQSSGGVALGSQARPGTPQPWALSIFFASRACRPTNRSR
jgi:PIN domain nuclease of toxin-antitoxin system